MKNQGVTICIPTYRRANLLTEVLESCLAQTERPDQIIVGVDAPDDDTLEVLKRFSQAIPLLVLENSPPLGQSGNVQRIFSEVKTSHLCLIHDDDLLECDAVARAKEVFGAHPEVSAVFSSQKFVSNDGLYLEDFTMHMNRTYGRDRLQHGRVEDAVTCAVIQQFPNDGFFLSTTAANSVGYEPPGGIGDACDWWFAVEVARQPGCFWFLPGFLSSYRVSAMSVLRGNSKANGAYGCLKHFFDHYASMLKNPLVDQWVGIHMPGAIYQAARAGDRLRGLRWYFSKWHRGKILSAGGIRRLLALLISPF